MVPIGAGNTSGAGYVGGLIVGHWFGDNLVPSTLELATDELRTIGHAVNWRLNGPYHQTSPPGLSEEEKQSLRILFNELCAQQRVCQFGAASISLQIGVPDGCADGQMQLPPAYYRLIRDAVASLVSELQHSPAELEIITGWPAAHTSELLSRIEAVCD